jgi:hypothetical protein
MKQQKMSLANIQGKLSRAEMKSAIAGLGGGTEGGYKCCWTGTTNCSVCVPAGQPTCVKGADAVKC